MSELNLKVLESHSTDPWQNLAMEECLLNTMTSHQILRLQPIYNEDLQKRTNHQQSGRCRSHCDTAFNLFCGYVFLQLFYVLSGGLSLRSNCNFGFYGGEQQL